MAQRLENSGFRSDNGWLLTLVDTFARTEQLGDVRCDEELLSAVRMRLERGQAVGRKVSAMKNRFQPQH